MCDALRPRPILARRAPTHRGRWRRCSVCRGWVNLAGRLPHAPRRCTRCHSETVAAQIFRARRRRAVA